MQTIRRYVLKILAYIVFALLWVLSLVPFTVAYVLSDMLFVMVYYVVRYRRRVVRANLTSAFPEKEDSEIRQTERAFYHWFCDYIVETFKLMTISESEMKRRMVFKGTDVIDAIVGEGQSCGVMLGHYCNWEWVSTLPLSVKSNGVCAELYHPIENPDFDRLFLYMRQRFGSVCIPMQETLRHMVRYQREGRQLIIGYIADQKPLWRNIHLWVDFLNHTTPVFTGSERLIRHGRQAFFYGDVRRVKRGFYECEFRLIDRHPEAMEENELTRIYMRELEKSIRRDPSLWLWSHNRWSRTKEEFDLRFEVRDGKVYEKINEVQYAQMQAEERRKKKKEAGA